MIRGCFLLPLAALHAEPAVPAATAMPSCEDKVPGRIQVDPDLKSTFFTSTKASYPWHVIENEDGSLSSTLGEALTAEDRRKIEHTSNCVSDHQGEHAMDFCEAVMEGGKLTLTIDGGLPAYASGLEVSIDGDRFTCGFSANYPGPPRRIEGWRIVRKELRVKKAKFEAGSRYFAWISVGLEEGTIEGGKVVWRPYKIEGFLKPVVRKAG